jgi:hypothetical protein
MKVLRNPFIVGALAVGAVGALAYNIAWPLLKRAGNPPFRPPAGATAPQPAPLSAAVNSPPADPPARPPQPARSPESPAHLSAPVGSGILSAQGTEDRQWMMPPHRDPFRQIKQVLPPEGPPAKASLTLQGIWRQPNSTLAAINNRILSEGETILEFKIEAIEGNCVWVQGPHGRESIEFKLLGPAEPPREKEMAKTSPVEHGKLP